MRAHSALCAAFTAPRVGERPDTVAKAKRTMTHGARISSILLCTLLAAASCGSGDDGGHSGAGTGKVEHTFLTPGVGPTNKEPLWPMKVGARYRFDDGEWTVARKSNRHGPAWILEQASGRPHPFLDWFGRNQGRPEAYWSVDTAGLVLRANGNQTTLDVPRLVVPATVRRGMKWETRAPDGTVWLKGEIDAGDNQDTLFGRRRVWTLRIDVPNRGTWEQDFIEGRGPVGTRYSLVPLAEKAAALPSRTKLQSTGIAPLVQKAAVTSFSVIEDPKTGQPEANMGLYVPGIDPEDVGVNGVYYVRYPYRRSCFVTEGAKLRGLDARLGPIAGVPAQANQIAPHDYDIGPCQDAAGVVQLSNGERMRLPMSSYGFGFIDWPNPTHCLAVQGMKCNPRPLFVSHPTGAYADAAPDTFRAFVYNDPDSTGATILGHTPRYEPGHSEMGFALLQSPVSDSLTTNWGSWLQPHSDGAVKRMVALGPASDAGMDTVFHSAGWIGHANARRRIKGGIDGPSGIEPWIGEHVSIDLPDLNPLVTVLHGDNTRDLYEASEDGLIWKWKLVDGTLQRSFLTALQLPAGEQVVGIVPTSANRLQVWTQDGIARGWEEAVFGVGIVYYWIESATQHVRYVDIGTPPPSEAPPLWQGLQVSTTGRDVLLCAPRGRTLPDTPWTLGGQPTRIVRQDERCLLLVRSYTAVATPPPPANEDRSFPLPNPDHWLLKGNLPDLGEVEIGISPEDHTTVAGLQIPLKNGGFLGGQVRAGRGLGVIERGGADIASPIVADPRDEGLWVLGNLPDCPGGGTCPAAVHFFWDSPAFTSFPYGAASGSQGNAPKLTTLPDGLPAMKSGAVYTLLDPVQGAQNLSADPHGGMSMQGVALWPLGLSYRAGRGLLWRSEEKTGAIAGVRLPRGERFRRIDGLFGACAADGVCFLAVAGASSATAPQAWAIFRADRVGSGLHEVTSGWGDDTGVIAGLLADKDTLILHDGQHVLWRGFRDSEPKTCANCATPEDSCLRGFCACTFGQISFDGLCGDEAGTKVYASCKDALAAGASLDKPVRIDGDGAGPSPQVLTRCVADPTWSPMPTYFEPTTALSYASVGCSSGLPPPSGYKWYLMSSAAALHGEFEVEFEFGDASQGGMQFPLLVLAPLSEFTPEGNVPALCAQTPYIISPDQIAVGAFNGSWVVLTHNDLLDLGAGHPGPLWMHRDGAGIVRVGSGSKTLWTSAVPFKRDSRLVKIESIPLTVKSLRWKGSTPDFCVPECKGLGCGPDGCGGSCGTCIADAHCDVGQCTCNEPLYGDGKSCATPVGTEAFPASSCAAATAIVFPWSASPWIDPDGPGGEAPFKQAQCMDWKPWTIPPQAFLGTAAMMTWDPTAKSCKAWAQLPGPPASPASNLGGNGQLDGSSVPAGQSVAATWRTFESKSFTMMAILTLGPAGQAVRVHLDAAENFAKDSAAWTGWMPACGLSADTSKRVTLTWDAQGLWASVGSAAPQLVLADGKTKTVLTIQRQDNGTLKVSNGGSGMWFQYDGPLPAKLRAVGEVEGGGAATLTLGALQWM